MSPDSAPSIGFHCREEQTLDITFDKGPIILRGHRIQKLGILIVRNLTLAHFKGLSLHVVFMLIPMLHNHKREEHAKILSDLTQIIEAGGLKPILDEQRFTLEQATEAHARLQSGKAMGKVVIENH